MPAAVARRVLGLALASRVAVLALMLLCDWAFRDLDTSARLQGFPCAADGGGGEEGRETALGTAGRGLWCQAVGSDCSSYLSGVRPQAGFRR